MPSNSINVGEIIAKHRNNKNYTQEYIAEKLEVSIESVSKMERGIISPSLKRLEQFADIFDCELSDLITEGSTRLNDQSAYINSLLDGLSENDRTMIVGIVEDLSKRLKLQQA